MRARDSIYYDLEGPVSSQDNAHRVCAASIRDGGKLFPVLSRYVLTLAQKGEYEPGDTLGLIAPFLIEAGVTEADIRAVSAEAGLVPGIPNFFVELQEEGCLVWIVSTSYEQHALSIAERVGLPSERVYCTRFPLDQLRTGIGTEELTLVREIREKAIGLFREDLESGASDKGMWNLLNPFYRRELPKTRLTQAIAGVKVMGGRRKLWALEEAIQASGNFHLSEAFVVVDSITDWRMAQAVEAAGGIALAWNANWYALPWCSCSVAAVDARAVRPLFKAWREGGRPAVREFVESAPEPEDSESGPYYHWLDGKGERFAGDVVLPIHQRLRTICRGKEVAKLG